MLLQQMRDRQPRAQRGAMAAIEREQFLDRPVPQRMIHAAFDEVPDPSRTEPLAFEAEKGDLVEWIDDAQAIIEFQTVDDPDLVIEPNMLGPQIAVPVHNAAMAQARGN